MTIFVLKSTVTVSVFSFHSGANIHAEDQTLCTPVLTAAVNNKVEAFHCLMELVDLKNDQRNPIFQVLQVKKHRVETLEVSLHIVSRLALVVDISQFFFNSFLLLTLSGVPN